MATYRWVGLLSFVGLFTAGFLAISVSVPALFGLRPVAISSASMSPTVQTGDVVLARPSDGAGLDPGTVVVFDDPNGDGLMTHRIVAVTPDGDYVTKGDANGRPDSTPLAPAQVVGVGDMLVPAIALPAVWLQTGAWLKLGAFALVVAVTLMGCRCLFVTAPIDLRERLEPYLRGPSSEMGSTRQRPFSQTGQTRQALPRAAAVTLIAALPIVGVTALALASFGSTTVNPGNSLVAGTWSGGGLDLYLHNDPTPPTGDTTSHTVLSMDGTTPTASTLYNYDTDRDSFPGLVIAKGVGLADTDPNKHQDWQYVSPTELSLQGTARLTLWTAMKDFANWKRGDLVVGLYDCDAGGGDCSLLASASITDNTWPSTWEEKQIDLGSVDHTISAGRSVLVKVATLDPSDDALWFAYDTTAHQSVLSITPPRLRDEFTAVAYDGSDGLEDWSTNPWVEGTDDPWEPGSDFGDPTTGRVRVVSAAGWCTGSNCLRLEGDSGVRDIFARRQADLSAASSATLTFDYRRRNYYSCRMRVQASADGGSNWTTLATYWSNGGDSSIQSASIDLTTYLASNTQIRFISDAYCDPGEYFYADNVQIVHDG